MTAPVDLPYVDAHVHFWDPAVLKYPWLSNHPTIAAAHGPSALRAELAGALPCSLVFVQSECERDRFLDEVQWVETMAQSEALIAAIVAFAPMDQGARTTAILESLGRRPLVRGVRHLIQDDPDESLCRRPAFVAGVRIAGQHDLVFELCVRAWQLPAAIDLVGACPGTRFVLDHAGKPGVAERRLDPWRAHVRELAAFPHVVCKVSGLITEAPHTGSAREELRPYVDHLIGCFGARRLLFGSDWPVVKLASTGLDWLETAHALVRDLGPSDRRAIFSETARQTYGLK